MVETEEGLAGSIEYGGFELPDSPGMGVEINEALLEPFIVKGQPGHRVRVIDLADFASGCRRLLAAAMLSMGVCFAPRRASSVKKIIYEYVKGQSWQSMWLAQLNKGLSLPIRQARPRHRGRSASSGSAITGC